LKAIPNYNKRYYHKYFEEFWFDEYSYAAEFLDSITLGYETYMFNINTGYSHMWPHLHTYLGDLRCINFNQAKDYYNDDSYQSNNSEYQNFLNFVFNKTKLINNLQANYKNLPGYLKITKNLDYILIDSFSNPNLCELMLNDTTHFKNIFQCRIFNLIFLFNSIILRNPNSLNISVFIFQTKN
jgi:hypothetical protein